MTAAAGRSPHRPGASIGSVLTQLRAEFPDVTISKIRFLESEGLVRPERTASGYRQFSPSDVQRLRYVLAAQRDHYLPLKVIKEHLDAMDRGEHGGFTDGVEPPLPLPLISMTSTSGAAGPENSAIAADTVRMTQEELLTAAGISAATLAELEQFGLIRPGPAGFYDPEAVQVARTVRGMIDFGLKPRHLRPFRSAADREIGLLAQLVTPMSLQRDPDARARAEEVMRELAALSVRLHALLVRAGLRNAIGNGASGN